MRVAQIRKTDVANGTGVGVALFVSGCTHNCKGCFNKEYQDFDYGVEWDSTMSDKIIELLKRPFITRFTVLGGEPLQQIKDEHLLNLLERVKYETDVNVWLYTGYRYEELMSNQLKHHKKLRMFQFIDVLVDGRFEEDKKDWKLRFRGSSNQRIINLKESRRKLEVVTYDY